MCTGCAIPIVSGLLAQSAERGADNATVVSSILTQTNFFVMCTYARYQYYCTLQVCKCMHAFIFLNKLTHIQFTSFFINVNLAV